MIADLVGEDDKLTIDNKFHRLIACHVPCRERYDQSILLQSEREFPQKKRVVVEDKMREKIPEVKMSTLSNGTNFVFLPGMKMIQ